MLTLLALLGLPVIIALAGFLLTQSSSRYRITLKEMLIMEGVAIVLISGAYALALRDRTSDTEVWNGVVVRKDHGTSGCCHSYSCNCVESCSGAGTHRSCSTTCQTCYEHSHDYYWSADSSTGDRVYNDTCRPPGSHEPARWTSIRIGEPAAAERAYENYIRGNPNTILRHRGLAQKFVVPSYPRVYDLYRIQRVLPVGVALPDLQQATALLDEVNARLGSVRQVNITLVVTASPDPEYAEALREAWLGGKKNDVVVILGTPAFPEIAWASVVSWTKQEDFKINLRDHLVDLKTWDPQRVVQTIATDVQLGFKRRPMADFEYLWATIEPSPMALWTIGILGTILQLLAAWWFWRNNTFDENPRYGVRGLRTPGGGLRITGISLSGPTRKRNSANGVPNLLRWR
jgi:hypothetical protein